MTKRNEIFLRILKMIGAVGLLLGGGSVFSPLLPAAPDAVADSDRAESIPQLGCWFWGDPAYFDLGPDGRSARNAFLDAITVGGVFDALSTSTRYDIEVTDPVLHDLMKEAAVTARERFGVGLLLDLDIRMARRAFEKEFPDCRQESLHFAETPLSSGGDGSGVTLDFSADLLTDHYTGHSVPYWVRSHRLLRVWFYRKGEEGGILPDSIRDVTDRAGVNAEGENRVRVTFRPTDSERNGGFVTAAVAFGYLYPDIFSPELIPFEKKILRSFADVPLAGTCKDEWGFPPCFNPEAAQNEFWFSPTMADAYRLKTGRDLTDDLFLAWRPQSGQEESRAERIDDYHRLCFDRHVEIETEYVRTSKEIFGDDAFSATHPSWWPWPDAHEFKKNGLSWWSVPRDVAQTDECVPYFCRNALAKKTGTVWINMFYAPSPEPYLAETWGGVLSGGRVNIHPLYPVRADDSNWPTPITKMTAILGAGVEEARRRIRLVDFISDAPVDSPIAVVFGHFGGMNPARPEWNRVGTEGIALCRELARRGFPADLIPSSESGAWRRHSDGRLCYGVQRYETVIFFGENRSDAADFAALRGLLSSDGDAASQTRAESLSATASNGEIAALAERVAADLIAANHSPVTSWTTENFWGDYSLSLPPKSGFARMTDGTEIRTMAEVSGAGDRFVLDREETTGDFGTVNVSAAATGLLAFRFDADGKLSALAAGGLERFSGGGVEWTPETVAEISASVEGLETSERNTPPDLAVKRESNGRWSGVLLTKSGRRIDLCDSLLAGFLP